MSEDKKNKHVFVGDYVLDTIDFRIASAVSGQHSVKIGPPGWGKTAIDRELAKVITSGKPWSFTRFDPSTPVEQLQGAYDPAALLNGELKRVTDDTPYQDGNTVALLDEVFRPSEPMFDAMLDTLDRKDVENGAAAVCWGTANFVAVGERTEALIDRFALWSYDDPVELDSDAIIDAHLQSFGMPSLPDADDIPNWDDIEAVRKMEPTEQSRTAIKRFVAELVEEAAMEGRRPHPRRLAQWAMILFRVSALYHGSNDFDQLHEKAKNAMQWAYPATTAEEAASWRQIVLSISDRVGAALEAILADAVTQFKEVAAINSAVDRNSKLADLGVFLASAQESIQNLPDDPRCQESIELITAWFGKAAKGDVGGIRR